MKNLREEVEKIGEIVLWGFPSEYTFDKDLLEAYQRGKEDTWEEASNHLCRIFRSWALEMVNLLDEYSRIEIIHEDGSKSRAILEGQVEQWRKVVQEKIEEEK